MTIFTFRAPAAAVAGSSTAVRVCFKDNIAVKGMPLTCASRTLLSFVSPYDADCVALLRQHDRFVIVGKTNMDEFGMGSSTRHSVHGACGHPVLPDSTPGGSSGGSAAAVLAGLADVGVGSDTGGSVRLPAAFCGLVGFKPAYGAISRHGLVSYAPTLDCVGLLATQAKVAALYDLYSVMSSRSLDNDMTFVGDTQDQTKQPKGVILLEDAKRYCDPRVWNDTLALAARIADQHGLPLRSVPWDRFKEAMAAYCCIASIEALSCLQRYPLLSTGQTVYPRAALLRPEFGPEVDKRLRMGALLARLSFGAYSRADRLRQSIGAELRDMAGDSIVVLPTAPKTPPTVHRSCHVMDEPDHDLFTIPFSLAGLPVWSVPGGAVPWAAVQLCFTNPHFIYRCIVGGRA